MEKIDFVITWVDGDDPMWLAERQLYLAASDSKANHPSRFRDWGLLRYWFRGVEKFAPWVNHIWFVTWGHVPEWLNINHPEITIVKHTDFIPAKYLPTYNSNTILLNIHRIPGLSEKFVLFNDDMFLTAPVDKRDFFRKGLPCDSAILGALTGADTDLFLHMLLNNVCAINRYFDKKEVMRRHWTKFFSPRYGKNTIRNGIYYSGRYFSNFRDAHLPSSYCKESYEIVWDAMEEELDCSCQNRFRTRSDYTEWLVKNWQYCRGAFSPRKYDWGISVSLKEAFDMNGILTSSKYKCICLNDSVDLQNVEELKRDMQTCFQSFLPERSSYELYE